MWAAWWPLLKNWSSSIMQDAHMLCTAPPSTSSRVAPIIAENAMVANPGRPHRSKAIHLELRRSRWRAPALSCRFRYLSVTGLGNEHHRPTRVGCALYIALLCSAPPLTTTQGGRLCQGGVTPWNGQNCALRVGLVLPHRQSGRASANRHARSYGTVAGGRPLIHQGIPWFARERP